MKHTNAKGAGCKKHRRIHSVHRLMVFMVTFSVLIAVLVTSLFFYTKTADVLTQQAKTNTNQLLNQVNSRVQSQIDMIDTTFPLFVANPIIRDYIEPTSARFTAPQIEKKIEIQKQMSYLLINTYLWDEKFINAVYLFDTDGNAYCVSKSNGGIKEFGNNKRISDSVPINSTSLKIFPSDKKSQSIYFVRTINSLYVSNYIATIVIDIDDSAFRDAYSRGYSLSADNIMISLVDAENNQLSSTSDTPYSAEVFSYFLHGGLTDSFKEIRVAGKDYFAASKLISGADIHSFVAVSKSSVFSGLNQTLYSFFPVALIITLIMLLLAVLLSTLITKPIQTMMQKVKRISGGNLSVEIPMGIYSEFNELAGALNVMQGEIYYYYQDLYEKQLLLKNAEIKSLQSQINPHFLFNVLDTIGWKAQIAGNEEISNMVISLGELLRANILNNQSDEIKLQDELGYVKFYLYLQKARFEDKFLTDIQISDNCLLNCRVPRLSMQPIVENAIVHGLENKTGQGHLNIKVRSEKKDLIIEVEDDGMGFDTDSLPEETNETFGGKHTHIGIRNIDRRISLLYGDEYGLTMNSIPNVGTKATIRIPMMYEEAP